MRKFLILVPILAQCVWQASHADSIETKHWNASTYEFQSRLVSVGYDKPLANAIINECKATAKDPRRCATVAAFIGKSESTAGQSLDSCNNVFGVTGGCYATRTEAVKEFVKKYNRYWFNQKSPESFYSSVPNRKPKTWYCLSEHSSGSKTHCPNGNKNAWHAYSILTK